MKPRLLILTSLLILMWCCSKDKSCDCDLNRSLEGNSYTFLVDRICTQLNVQFPDEELSEECYTQINEDKSYDIIFSANGENVTIDSSEITGTLQTVETQKEIFYLDEGLFAGGRFVVWKQNGILEAELTVYGSGRPIVGSERGTLILNSKN